MGSIKKGEIYLANLGDRKNFDIGKVRPVLVFQNNFLNMMLEDTKFKDVVVLPLSSQIRTNDFSFFIKQRDNLEKDSTVLCNAIKMIDRTRLMLDKGILTKLSNDEIIDIENILYNLFGCNNK
jgi:mRNA interferase MazF